MDWPSSLDEYEKLVIRMNTPRVVIDNTVCSTETLVKVDSAWRDGILLEAVQALADLDLSIKKAYVSSDGPWFMNVFHVTDRFDEKLADERVIACIQRSLGGEGDESVSESASESSDLEEPYRTLELVAADRPGLLSDVFALLADLGCSVAEARLWTHRGLAAALLSVKDEESGLPIDDSDKIRSIEDRLRHVVRCAATVLSPSSASGTDADRRLHQLMLADGDYERALDSGETSVSVQNWEERGYSVVSVHCRDRPKLLFDVLSALADLGYIVFHGTVDCPGGRAYQEFCIRRSDGTPITSGSERQRAAQCLGAAIERRSSAGLRLELCTADPVILAMATRTFRENGLSVARAEMSTKGKTAVSVFYVTDAAGHPACRKTIEAVTDRMGDSSLKAGEDRQMGTGQSRSGSYQDERTGRLLYLGSLLKRNLSSLGLTRS